VVTGAGVISPLGSSSRELLERWLAGECAVHEGVARCRDFDPAEHMSTKEVRRSDRFTQLALAASREAVESSRALSAYDSAAVGCVIGTSFGGLSSDEREIESFSSGDGNGVSPLAIPRSMPNAAAAAIAIRYGVHGPSGSIGSACAAGADAIGTAVRMIQAGDAEAMLAGGAEAPLSEYGIARAHSSRAHSKLGISRPFDARRDGLVMGEGAAVLMLESREAAERRGAPIAGEILGYAATTDAYNLSAPEPGGAAATAAMRRALADARLEPGDVDYVNAHGTSTTLNDRSETAALKQAFGEAIYAIPVSSTKSAIGHLLGASGAVELAVTLDALHAGLAPPTLGYELPEQGLDLNYVAGASQPLRARGGNGSDPRRVALSSSLGFGGHNAVLCVAVG
jgi:3-oxoacyl-[acyl-carrier-protein] synthase II